MIQDTNRYSPVDGVTYTIYDEENEGLRERECDIQSILIDGDGPIYEIEHTVEALSKESEQSDPRN